ncbi:diguanylate cyclase [Anoxybacillus flavithermus NBRC 109594]|uniref:Diguanylate cyclase n=1 Tax=Anoxybacillus flavithermus NBRC 109594 TaxID=1315967 RepID=R4G6I4_9BACL|nr:sensor domain-containing diguanylate cyclase [Anoxybacillus flavithermus]GAC90987.1 diguanylate cyclase [Anoxybacillus flavithermus NBRC 109594]
MKKMNVQERDHYAIFKQKFFDWFLSEEDFTDLPRMIQALITLLQNEFHLLNVTFYTLNPFKHVFEPEMTTDRTIERYRERHIVPFDEQLKKQFDDVVILDEKSEIKTVQFGIHFSEDSFGLVRFQLHERDMLPEAFVNKLRQDFLKVFARIRKVSEVLSEEKRYEQLHRAATKIHASMNIGDVLEEIVKTLKEVYPTFTCHLFLSYDSTTDRDLPIKLLTFENEDEHMGAMQAYVTGQIQLHDSLVHKKSVIYAPIKGAQGIYGVIEMIAPTVMELPEREMRFISLLANTAGSALENAKLYEQSKRLIADLQLINETIHHLNTNLRFQDALQFMIEKIKTSFDAEEVGFIILQEKERKVLPGSTAFFQSREAKAYVDFVFHRIQHPRDTLFLGDVKIHSNDTKRFRSLMAVPMMRGMMKGVAIVLHQEAYHFSFDMFKLLQSLIHHSTLAFTNAALREELERMVITDRLTNLYARHYLDERIQRSMEEDGLGTFILIDIDNFKKVNDTYGHQVGDEIIIQVANIIKANIRQNDIGARWGGEELAIYLPKVSIHAGVSIANRLVQKVRELTNPPVTISCGVSYWKKNRADSVKELFNRADEALYTAKRTGKNRVVVQEY